MRPHFDGAPDLYERLQQVPRHDGPEAGKGWLVTVTLAAGILIGAAVLLLVVAACWGDTPWQWLGGGK